MRGKREEGREAGWEVAANKPGVQFIYCWCDGGVGLDCYLVMVADNLFSKLQSREVVTVYLD